MATSYYSEIMRLKPLCYYPLNDTMGSATAKDVSGNGANGTVNGGVTFGQAPLIKASTLKSALLDGSSGYIAAASGITNGLAALSLLIWFKLTGNPAGYTVLMANSTIPSSNHNGVAFYLAPAGDGSSGYFELGNGTTGVACNLGVGVLSSGLYFAVATYDGAHIWTYLNGQLKDGSAITGTIGTAPNVLTIGCDASSPGDFLLATIAHVAVLPLALTADQIAWLYRAGQGAGILQGNHRSFGRIA